MDTDKTDAGEGVRAATAPPPEPAPAVEVPEPPKGSGKDDATMETYGLTSAEVAILATSYLAEAPRVWQAYFLTFCKRRNFDPFAKVVYLTKARAKNENGTWEDRWQIVTGINGYRTISARSSLYRGQSRPVWTKDEDGRDYCEVIVYRAVPNSAGRNPMTGEIVTPETILPHYGIAYLDEFMVTKDETVWVQDDPDDETTRRKVERKVPVGNWGRMGTRRMISVRAEANGHTKAFPEETSGLLLEDEARDSFLLEQMERENARPIQAALPVLPGSEWDDEIEAARNKLKMTVAAMNVQIQRFGGDKERFVTDYLRPLLVQLSGTVRHTPPPTEPSVHVTVKDLETGEKLGSWTTTEGGEHIPDQDEPIWTTDDKAKFAEAGRIYRECIDAGMTPANAKDEAQRRISDEVIVAGSICMACKAQHGEPHKPGCPIDEVEVEAAE
jgi:RecT family protein